MFDFFFVCVTANDIRKNTHTMLDRVHVLVPTVAIVAIAYMLFRAAKARQGRLFPEVALHPDRKTKRLAAAMPMSTPPF